MMASKSERSLSVPVVLAAALCCAVIALGSWFYVSFLPANGVTSWEARGNAMAPFAALIAGLALVAAVASVLLQGAELRLQRLETVETRSVLEGQRRVQEEQASALRQHADELQTSNYLTEKLVKAQERSNDLAEQLIRAEERNLVLQEQANKFQVYLIEAQRQAERATLRSAWATLVTKFYEINRHQDDKPKLIKHIKMVEEEIDSMVLAANPYNGRRISDRMPAKHPGSFYGPGELEREEEHRRGRQEERTPRKGPEA